MVNFKKGKVLEELVSYAKSKIERRIICARLDSDYMINL
jgi:hypothetical protein